MTEETGDPALDRFLSGDVEAVAETLRLVRGAVSARGFYIPADERTEVAQEAMMQLLRYFAELGRERPRDFAAFVRTIAYRRCVDWMRRQTPVEPLSEDLEAAGASPEAALIEREKLAIGQYVLSAIKESCRDLIQRYSCEGLTFRQIAESDGRLEKTVRNQMYKCLDQARALVDRMRRRERLGLRAFGGTP